MRRTERAGKPMPTIDEIQNDVACPACQYNLRGLHGAVVNCPECGITIDVAKLISSHWTGRWSDAPGYRTIQAPAKCFVLALPVLGFIFLRWGDWGGMLPFAVSVVVGFLIASAISSYSVVRKFGWMEAVRLVMLCHVLLCGYLLSLLSALGTLVWAVVDVRPFALFFTAVAIGLMFACQHIDRILAEGCIRRHLQDQSRVE